MDYLQHYRRDLSLFDYTDLSPSQREDERRRFQVLARVGGFQRGDVVLDVGSGSGWLSKLMADRSITSYGLDLSPEQWRRGSEVLGGKRGGFVVGDALRLPFKDLSVDGVFLSEVLEHIGDPDRVLAEGFRVLKLGGKIVLSVPFDEKIRYTLCVHCNRPTPVNAHLHTFDSGRLQDVCRKARFQVRRSAPFMPKALSLSGLNRLISFLPYPVWRAVEMFLLRVLRRPNFLICLGEKTS